MIYHLPDRQRVMPDRREQTAQTASTFSQFSDLIENVAYLLIRYHAYGALNVYQCPGLKIMNDVNAQR